MIDLNNINQIYLYTNEVDMRMGIIKIEAILSLSFTPIEILNSAFIFVSKNRKQIKIYYEDEYGKWLLINKLSYTTFLVPSFKEGIKISKQDLSYLLKGVALLEQRLKEVSI